MKPSDPEKAAEAVSIIDAHYLATFGTERRDAINRLIAAARTAAPDAVREALAKAQHLAYPHSVYMASGQPPDENGLERPGSPYDRGRYDAANAIRQYAAALSPQPAGPMRSGGAAIEQVLDTISDRTSGGKPAGEE